MDLIESIFRTIFYVIASVIAILTFIKAKNGLLNSVNTEYQKKVMDRLGELSNEIWDEFDFSSDNHWSKDKTLSLILDDIHKYAIENKTDILAKNKYFHGGVPLPKTQIEMLASLERLKSDPFIPPLIRKKLVNIIENRVNSTFEAFHRVINDYQSDLANGKRWGDFDLNKSLIHNEILSIMRNNGAGIEDLQNAAHEVRLEIQKYYESFNPIKS